MATTTPARALIYCRISRDRSGAGLGVERQETDCRALAERLGLIVVGEPYVDNDVSAYSGKPRPAYKRMCADLADGAATVVIAWHTDRLHRSNVELESWITMAEPLGIVVQTVRAGELDLATANGRMTARIVGAVARHESEHKSERIRAQKVQRAASGTWLGGRRPFGFAADGVTHVEDEAKLIEFGTASLLAGRSVRSIVDVWNASGVTTTTGRAHSHKSVVDALRRWRNAGLHEHLGESGVTAQWDKIVERDQVQGVRMILAANAAAHGAVGNTASWLLSGIALCGGCGAVLRAVTSTRRDRVYRCTNYGHGHVTRIAQPIDDQVMALTAAVLAREGFADRFTPAGVDRAALQADYAAATAVLADIAEMVGDGRITLAEMLVMRAGAAARQSASSVALAASVRSSPVDALARSADPAAAFRAADLDTQRATIRALWTITVQRQGPGRRAFDPDTVEIVAR